MQTLAPDCFQAAEGQLELIGKGSVFTSQANASISLGSHTLTEKYLGPYNGLVQQPSACLMG
jgi:hypothetical protein